MFELGVSFDELFCAATGEAYGDATVFVFAFDAYHGTDAVFRVADFLAEERIGFGYALDGGKGGAGS